MKIPTSQYWYFQAFHDRREFSILRNTMYRGLKKESWGILTSLTVSSGRSNETIACKCLCCVSEAWPSCLGPSRGGVVSSSNPSLSLSSTRSTAPLTRAKLSLVCGNERLISNAFLQETLHTLQYTSTPIIHLFWSGPRLGMSSSLKKNWADDIKSNYGWTLNCLDDAKMSDGWKIHSEEFMWCSLLCQQTPVDAD